MTTDKNGPAKGKKPHGYWKDPANVIAEAKAVVAAYGPAALAPIWLRDNGHGSLNKAITEHGGFGWIRAELDLEQGNKPRGYWDDPANVIAEAKAIVEDHGPKALTSAWLQANGHGGLIGGIAKQGGYAWLKSELGLEAGRKPNGYWDDPANVIAEARAVVGESGPATLTAKLLKANGYGYLDKAIRRHGGYAWIRAELGLDQGRKSNGYWKDSAHVIAEAKAIVEEHGPEALNQIWLYAHGHSSLGAAITKHGGYAWIRAELGLDQGRKPPCYWNPETVIATAKAIVEEHGSEALAVDWLYTNGYSNLSNAINRHGGLAWIRAELGLDQGKKSKGYWEDPANVIAEAKAIVEEHGPEALTSAWLQANGHGSLAQAIANHGGIAWLREKLGIEAPANLFGGDSVKHALDCTGNFIRPRNCVLYVIEMKNHPGYCKVGIAFNYKTRADGEYVEEEKAQLIKTLPTRQEPYLIEQATLDATRCFAEIPEGLEGWGGAGEIRRMPVEDLEAVALAMLQEAKECGLWEMSSLRVPMRAHQRAICQQRALAGAPACAPASTAS